MKELAKRDNVYCKLSGMATEADHGGWGNFLICGHTSTVAMEAFGPSA